MSRDYKFFILQVKDTDICIYGVDRSDAPQNTIGYGDKYCYYKLYISNFLNKEEATNIIRNFESHFHEQHIGNCLIKNKNNYELIAYAAYIVAAQILSN